MVRPVFRKGRIVAYTLSITHLPDIGGSGFGSSAAEVYHEGLRLPICKLYEAGQAQRAARRDHPHQRARARAGDGRRDGQRRLQRGRRARAAGVHGRVRPRRPRPRCRAPSAASPRRPCAPRSASSARAPTATASRSRASTAPATTSCASTSKGDSVAFDFAGTSGCVRAGVNVPFCYTNAMALHAIKSLLLPNIPNNAGSIAPISVFGAAGLHPQRAAALRHRRTPRHGAFRDAAGLRRARQGRCPTACRPSSGMMNLITFQGTRRDGRPFSTLYFAAGGYGALRRPRRLVHAAASLQHGGGAGRGVGDADAHHHREQAAAAGFGRPGPLARRPRPGGRPAQRHRPSDRHARHGQPHDVSRARHVRRRRRRAAGARHRRQAGARQGPQRAGARASACASSRPAAAATAIPKQRARRRRSPRTSRKATSARKLPGTSTDGAAEARPRSPLPTLQWGQGSQGQRLREPVAAPHPALSP